MRLIYFLWARFVTPPVFGVALSVITQRIIPQNRSKVKYQSAKLWCRVATGGIINPTSRIPKLVRERYLRCAATRQRVRRTGRGKKVPRTFSSPGGELFIYARLNELFY